MARIVVKKSEGKYKLFCNTVDQWVSPLLTAENLIVFMLETQEFKGDRARIIEKIVTCSTDSDDFYSWKECQKSHRRITRQNKAYDKKMGA